MGLDGVLGDSVGFVMSRLMPRSMGDVQDVVRKLDDSVPIMALFKILISSG